MARYGRDYSAGYHPQGGGMDRYDRFRYGPRQQQGWGGRPDMGEWGGYPDGRGPGMRGYDSPRRSRGWSEGRPGGAAPRSTHLEGRTGEPWGGRGTADDVMVSDIMTANPEAVTPDTPLSEVAAKMRELDVGIIPVVDDLDQFHLQGVITDRDIAVRAAAAAEDMKQALVSNFMTKEVQTVRENDHVRDVFTVMKRARVRRVPVTSEDGKLVGIVAQADLAVNYAGLDLQRETEVEEVIERISEPARPKWGGRDPGPTRTRFVARRSDYDRWYQDQEDLGDRVREGWNWIRREARHLMGGGYDRDWRR